MSASDKYFIFPLSILKGESIIAQRSFRSCVELIVDYGIFRAGKGYRTNNPDEFEEKFEALCEELPPRDIPDQESDEACVLVGAKVCGVRMGSGLSNLRNTTKRLKSVKSDGAFVRMKADFVWAAVEQARAEDDPSKDRPEHGLSWREFRILCAILSVGVNRHNFAFVGWETIQARACGFTKKSDFTNTDDLPEHLTPALTKKQISTTCAILENLGFYARFRYSSGKRGGFMAYSFRHSREELASAVADHILFRSRANITKNRNADILKSLEIQQRRLSGDSEGKGKE